MDRTVNDMTLDDIDGEPGNRWSTDENGKPVLTRDVQSALDSLKALDASSLFKHRRSELERKARQEANVPRKNTPKAARKAPMVTAVTTPVTADLLGHAPRPRKSKR